MDRLFMKVDSWACACMSVSHVYVNNNFKHRLRKDNLLTNYKVAMIL